MRERSVERGKGVTMSSTGFTCADSRVQLVLMVEGDDGWRNDVAVGAGDAPRTWPSETRLDGRVILLVQSCEYGHSLVGIRVQREVLNLRRARCGRGGSRRSKCRLRRICHGPRRGHFGRGLRLICIFPVIFGVGRGHSIVTPVSAHFFSWSAS